MHATNHHHNSILSILAVRSLWLSSHACHKSSPESHSEHPDSVLSTGVAFWPPGWCFFNKYFVDTCDFVDTCRILCVQAPFLADVDWISSTGVAFFACQYSVDFLRFSHGFWSIWPHWKVGCHFSMGFLDDFVLRKNRFQPKLNFANVLRAFSTWLTWWSHFARILSSVLNTHCVDSYAIFILHMFSRAILAACF